MPEARRCRESDRPPAPGWATRSKRGRVRFLVPPQPTAGRSGPMGSAADRPRRPRRHRRRRTPHPPVPSRPCRAPSPDPGEPACGTQARPLPLQVVVVWMDPPRVRSLPVLGEVPWPPWVRLSGWRRWGGPASRVPLAAAGGGGPPRGSGHTRSSAPARRGRSSKLLALPPEHPIRAPAQPPLGRTVATLAQRRSPARPRGTRQRLRPLGPAQPEDAEARRRAAAGPATPSATAASNGRLYHRGGRPPVSPPADARKSLPGPRRRTGPGMPCRNHGSEPAFEPTSEVEIRWFLQGRIVSVSGPVSDPANQAPANPGGSVLSHGRSSFVPPRRGHNQMRTWLLRLRPS